MREFIWNGSRFCESVKGDIGCKIDFYMVFAYKCVLAVCEHKHPTMIKIHSHFFILSTKKPRVSIMKPFWFSEQYDVILLRPRPQPLTDCPVLAYFRPQSSLSPDMRATEDAMD